MFRDQSVSHSPPLVTRHGPRIRLQAQPTGLCEAQRPLRLGLGLRLRRPVLPIAYRQWHRRPARKRAKPLAVAADGFLMPTELLCDVLLRLPADALYHAPPPSLPVPAIAHLRAALRKAHTSRHPRARRRPPRPRRRDPLHGHVRQRGQADRRRGGPHARVAIVLLSYGVRSI
jgi:hypothetical protein